MYTCIGIFLFLQFSITYFVPFDCPSQNAITTSVYSIICKFRFKEPPYRTYRIQAKIPSIWCDVLWRISLHMYQFLLRSLKRFLWHLPEDIFLNDRCINFWSQSLLLLSYGHPYRLCIDYIVVCIAYKLQLFFISY